MRSLALRLPPWLGEMRLINARLEYSLLSIAQAQQKASTIIQKTQTYLADVFVHDALEIRVIEIDVEVLVTVLLSLHNRTILVVERAHALQRRVAHGRIAVHPAPAR
jgi:hypothetical protein